MPALSLQPSAFDDLLLRETNHRCANDLQLVVSLLGLQSSKAASEETRRALRDAMERIAVLARSRAALLHHAETSLDAALRGLCEALQSQAEPRSILISLSIGPHCRSWSQAEIMTIALAVNELAVNAIKHGFREGKSGHIRIMAREFEPDLLTILVDDDGLPFPEIGQGTGLGLGLVKRLVAAIGGEVVVPRYGSKVFELKIPVSGQH